MPSSIFGQKPVVPQEIKNVMASGPSGAVFNRMYNGNPQFRAFADSVRNLTPEEAFRRNGLDFSMVRNLRW